MIAWSNAESTPASSSNTQECNLNRPGDISIFSLSKFFFYLSVIHLHFLFSFCTILFSLKMPLAGEGREILYQLN